MTAAEAYEPNGLGYHEVAASRTHDETIDESAQGYLAIYDLIEARYRLHEELGTISRAVTDSGAQYNEYILQTMGNQSDMVVRRRQQLHGDVAESNHRYNVCITHMMELDEAMVLQPAPRDFDSGRASEFGLDGLLLQRDEVRRWGDTEITRHPGQIDTHAVGRLLTDAVAAGSAFGNQRALHASDVVPALRDNDRDLWSEDDPYSNDESTAVLLKDGNILSIQHEV